MARNKITQKMNFRFSQEFADVRQYQRESNGNQTQLAVYVDIAVDGTGVVGQIVFGTDTNGTPSPTAITMKVRPANLGGGIDFFNNTGVKIASLDTSGNLKTKGTITGNTTP